MATGLTLVIGGVSAILLLDRLDYLARYWGLVLGEHGCEVEYIDRGLHEGGAAHDQDLAAALRLDRAADWGPDGPAR